ncbi:uncharacterized protein TNCV_4434921 [Trichonephila clavipes]|nr:uncharacterized protein TNCV_4434921 [Trichonephila clavipes]
MPPELEFTFTGQLVLDVVEDYEKKLKDGTDELIQQRERNAHLEADLAAARDEAHFWLNGYVNKQNCHIWSEANPQVCVETPLHPEKLTVWCALWAGGILLQKR